MTVLGSGVVVALGLIHASIQDLKRETITVRTFAYTAGLMLVPAVIFASPEVAGKMLVQGAVVTLIGGLFRLISRFGLGDMLALGLAGSQFYGTLAFRIAALLVVPMYLYMLIYRLFTNKRAVPAVPGITIGFLLLFFLFTVGDIPV